MPSVSSRRVSRGQCNGFLRQLVGFLDRSRYLIVQVTPQLSPRGWVNPVPDPLHSRKSGCAGNRTRDLCICSQKLWPLDHRGSRRNAVTNCIKTLQSHQLNWLFTTLSSLWKLNLNLKLGLNLNVGSDLRSASEVRRTPLLTINTSTRITLLRRLTNLYPFLKVTSWGRRRGIFSHCNQRSSAWNAYSKGKRKDGVCKIK
jgi:hypothetical protein